MRSFSEIETAVKRATRGIGFSWGVAEEVGKNIRLLEMLGLPGFKNINQYFKVLRNQDFEGLIASPSGHPADLLLDCLPDCLIYCSIA